MADTLSVFVLQPMLSLALIPAADRRNLEAEHYTAGSFHRAVTDRLAGFAEVLKSFAAPKANGRRARSAAPPKTEAPRGGS